MMISNMHTIYHIVIGSIVLLYYSTPAWCHVPFPQPGFLSDAIELEANLNETVVIPCVVHDLGKNTLRWWKDGMLLFDSSDNSLMAPPRYTILSTNMLMVDWLEPSDAGNYTCEIIRAYPRLPLEQVNSLRVRHPPRIITVPADGQIEALIGTEVQMGCLATGWPIPVVTWRFKDEIMKSTDNRHKLIFKAEDPEQSGVYVCEAKNEVGEPVTSRIILKILYEPEIKVERTWVHASSGMKTELACEVTGEPRPKVEWFFNKETPQLEASAITYRIRGNKHILSFRSLQDRDFGEYTCRATNKVGQVEQLIQLSGLAYPAVFKKNRGTVSPDSYSLIWEVESYSPIIEYKLLFREANTESDWIPLIIPADTNSPGPLHSKSYTLSGMKLFTVYEARILSRNRFGWSEPSELIDFGSDGVTDLVEKAVQPVSGSITSDGMTSTAASAFLYVTLATSLSFLQTFPVNL